MTSTITIYNNTDELVRVAMFKKPVKNPTLQSIAWQIADPPPHGKQTITIPANYEVFAEYSNDPADPSNLTCETEHLKFAELTARFNINSVGSQDAQVDGAVLEQSFNNLVMNEVRIYNNFATGCRTTIAKSGDAIYEPQVVWPGGLFLEDIRASFYMAVVAQFTYKGDRLVQEEFSQTETEVLEGGSIVITGSKWKGYSLQAQ